jgi:cell division protein ZapE
VVLAAAEPPDIYPGGDQSFEFQRTVSRLEEMRSEAWLEEADETDPAARASQAI